MGDDKIQPKMCAVCYIVLDRDAQGRWLHTRELVGKSDHVCVPVDYDEQKIRVMCDFCFDEILRPDVWTVPAKTFKVPVINHYSEGHWAACEACASLIGAGDWENLTTRASVMYQLRNPTNNGAVIHQWLGMLYGHLRKNMTGPPRPWQPGDEKVHA